MKVTTKRHNQSRTMSNCPTDWIHCCPFIIINIFRAVQSFFILHFTTKMRLNNNSSIHCNFGQILMHYWMCGGPKHIWRYFSNHSSKILTWGGTIRFCHKIVRDSEIETISQLDLTWQLSLGLLRNQQLCSRNELPMRFDWILF